VSASSLNQPFDVAVGKYNGTNALFVADKLNKRVLVYPPPPASNAPANAVDGDRVSRPGRNRIATR